MTYHNSTFGFTVKAPSGWQQKGLRAGGKGADFTGPNGATAAIYGSNNLVGDSPEGICQDQTSALTGDGANATYTMSGNRCWVTSSQAGIGRQLVTWTGSGSLNTIDVSYPPNTGASMTSVVQQLVSGFTPGDLSTGH